MNLSEDQKITRDLILSTDVIQDYIENEITFEECIDEFQSLKEGLDEHYHSKSNIIDSRDYRRLSEFNELLVQRSLTLELDDIPCPISESELQTELLKHLNKTDEMH